MDFNEERARRDAEAEMRDALAMVAEAREMTRGELVATHAYMVSGSGSLEGWTWYVAVRPRPVHETPAGVVDLAAWREAS